MDDQTLAAIIGLVGVVFGGAGLKAVERYFGHGDRQLDEGAEIRKELRERIRQLEADVRAREAELDAQKDRYYALLEENARLKADFQGLIRRLGELQQVVELRKETKGGD